MSIEEDILLGEAEARKTEVRSQRQEAGGKRIDY
jgi:hypothetical protein